MFSWSQLFWNPAAGRTRPFPAHGYYVGGTAAGQGKRADFIRQPLSAGGNGLDTCRLLRLQQERMGIGNKGELLPVLPLSYQFFIGAP